jgi:nicotinamidase-related amidase
MTTPPSPALLLDRRSTAVLLMDFQEGVVARVDPAGAGPRAARAAEVAAAAREAGVFVAHVIVGFRRGYPEVSERNQAFFGLRQSGRFLLDGAETAIVEPLSPRDGEPVVVKHRVGAFGGTDLEMLLRARHVDTLVLLGIATSGVVLSTLRHAADADYRIVVAEDGCADGDAEVHRVLMHKVFPRQATVASCEAIREALRA